MEGFVANLTSLIEETYNMNNKRRVVLLGHSMGNNYIKYLLNHQDIKWKNKYNETYISLSAPWAGSVKPLRLMASGTFTCSFQFSISRMTARSLSEYFREHLAMLCGLWYKSANGMHVYHR